VTGSIPFSIEESDNFKRSFKKLAKVHKSSFVELIAKTLEGLIDDQYPNNSRNEPLPGKIQLPEGWTFHKLEIWVSKGSPVRTVITLSNQRSRLIVFLENC
jgi:hypothetical protein